MFDNFIQFLYISAEGTGKYDIDYNGFMWRLF